MYTKIIANIYSLSFWHYKGFGNTSMKAYKEKHCDFKIVWQYAGKTHGGAL